MKRYALLAMAVGALAFPAVASAHYLPRDRAVNAISAYARMQAPIFRDTTRSEVHSCSRRSPHQVRCVAAYHDVDGDCDEYVTATYRNRSRSITISDYEFECYDERTVGGK